MRIASNHENFRELVSDGGSEPIYIGGELAYVSQYRDELDEIIEGDEAFVRQQPRNASRLRVLDRSRPQLHIAISKAVIDAVPECSAPVYLVADQYLAYGLSQKQDVIVMGGGLTAAGQLNLEIFVFTSQQLERTIEKTVSQNGAMLDGALTEVIAEFPEHAIHWCEPLGEPPLCDLCQMDGFIDAGLVPFKSPVKKRVESRATSVDEGFWLIPSLALLLLAGAVYGGIVAYEWKRVESARDEYRAEITGFEEAYQSGSQNLDLLRHRDHMIKADPDHIARVVDVETMLFNVAAINGVIIQSIRCFAEGDPLRDQASAGIAGNSPVEFEIEFSVPKTLASARDQAEPILAQLSSRIKKSVRVISHVEEARQIGGADLEYWRYKVVGSGI